MNLRTDTFTIGVALVCIVVGLFGTWWWLTSAGTESVGDSPESHPDDSPPTHRASSDGHGSLPDTVPDEAECNGAPPVEDESNATIREDEADATHPSGDSENPGDITLPEVEMQAGNPIRRTPPRLSWEAGAEIDFPRSDAVIDESPPREQWRVNSRPESKNTIELMIVLEGLIPETKLQSPALVHVIDQTTEEVRIAATVDAAGDDNSMFSGWFRLPYPEDTTFLVRASAGEFVGHAVFGTGPGAPPAGDPFGESVNVWDDRRFGFRVVVPMISPEQRRSQAASIHVTDRHDAPIEGATAYHMGGIIGQTDASGVVSFPFPLDVESAHGKFRRLWAAPVVVHSPGKVPVAVELSALAVGRTERVALRADEYVVRFNLTLPAGTRIREYGEGSHSERLFQLDRLVVPEDLKDAKGVLEAGTWPYARGPWQPRAGWSYYSDFNNTGALEDALGATFERTKAWRLYDYWYTRQWDYDENTGDWRVVVPHKGRFIIVIDEEYRNDENGSGDWVMRPGLYIDVRDPANPTTELLNVP